ncbi:hypothetical protein AUH73_07050 [archaeon 13_1_40CM_4_53_4]|nr:MAG: hypothetical protein AUH73_07050 [archaeon 13_1_40CM_4_53_4]OLE58928.1 MAG: hypothetical protein AUG17_05155 [Crenarchaeota archaeon 13_1_20CM_2_53_14]
MMPCSDCHWNIIGLYDRGKWNFLVLENHLLKKDRESLSRTSWTIGHDSTEVMLDTLTYYGSSFDHYNGFSLSV